MRAAMARRLGALAAAALLGLPAGACSTTPTSGGISGGDIAASADVVWVRVVDDALAVRIDPRTNAVVDRLGPPAGSGGVAIADTSVWFTAHDKQSMWRLPR